MIALVSKQLNENVSNSRQSKSESNNYPAPLAIPLPSYSVDPQSGKLKTLFYFMKMATVISV